MPKFNLKHAVYALPVLALAAVAPNAFPAAQAGFDSLHHLALTYILPAAALLIILTILYQVRGFAGLARAVAFGAAAGALATLALEVVRYPGFRLGFMPGNLPELMGVLLLDRFALGPSTASTLAGYAYHFWNGANFGIIFAVLAEVGVLRRSTLWATAYGVLTGFGFLASPVVKSLGGGLFGLEFGTPFLLTVTLAHVAFGAAYGVLLKFLYAWSRPKR